jgi:hypothetical protein
MRKGKSRMQSRTDILRSKAKNEAKKARVRKLKNAYQKQDYDGNQNQDEAIPA